MRLDEMFTKMAPIDILNLLHKAYEDYESTRICPLDVYGIENDYKRCDSISCEKCLALHMHDECDLTSQK